MPLYNVYQVHMTRERSNQIDAFYDKNGDYPEWYKHELDNRLNPTSETVNKLKEEYKLVAMIDARDLEHAFGISNLGDQEHRVTRFGRMHSMSVGDLIRRVDDLDGDFWVCDRHGFKEVKFN